MKVPRYKNEYQKLLSPEIVSFLRQIHEQKGQQYQIDKLYGCILTPDGLGIICAGLDNKPEKIGIHMLEMITDHGSIRSCDD